MDQTAQRRTNRNEAELRRVGQAVTQLARTLYVLPVVLAAVALALPVADLEVGNDATEAKSLFGLVGEFSDLQSALGVRPAVLVQIVALVVILVGGLVLAGGREDDAALDRFGPVAVGLAGAASILSAVALSTLLGSADHSGGEERFVEGPSVVRASVFGFQLLTGIVAVLVVQGHRRVRA